MPGVQLGQNRDTWDDILMDFITKLPKSKDPVMGITYDTIMVIVD